MRNRLAMLTAVMMLAASPAARANEKCSEIDALTPDILAKCVGIANGEIEALKDQIAVLKEEKEMLKSEVCILSINLREVAKGKIMDYLLDPPSHCTVPVAPRRIR
jgi:hypothetical protein